MTTTTDNALMQRKVKERQVQVFADNGKRTGLVPEKTVRGNQVTLMKSIDEGDLGTRIQGGEEKIRKTIEAGPQDQTTMLDQTPQRTILRHSGENPPQERKMSNLAETG